MCRPTRIALLKRMFFVTHQLVVRRGMLAELLALFVCIFLQNRFIFLLAQRSGTRIVIALRCRGGRITLCRGIPSRAFGMMRFLMQLVLFVKKRGLNVGSLQILAYICGLESFTAIIQSL